MSARIKDVAELAGVSTATVSRVIHQNGYVKAETERKVKIALEKLDYYPNITARSLKKKQTLIIGHIVRTIYPNPFFAAVSVGVEDEADRAGFNIITCNSHGNLEKESKFVKLLIQRMVDGVIFTTVVDKKSVLALKERDIPLVMVERPADVPGVDQTVVDNWIGAYEATEHLIKLKHRVIGFIGGPLEKVEQERLGGFLDAMKDNKLDVDRELIGEGSHEPESGYNLTQKILRGDKKPTAIFAASDLMAVGTMWAIYERGLKVPCDISVVGFDDTVAAFNTPRLTTVALPMYELGKTAAKLLIDRLQNGYSGDARVVTLKSKLVVRESTGVCRR